MVTMSRRPMQHIDRKDLYTSLESRIQYLHSFLDFSSRDVEALTHGAKYIQALIPAVVNIVYKKLLQYDTTARAFTTHTTASSVPIPSSLSESAPVIQHRKLFLRAYLTKLCSDPTHLEFWSYLDSVGKMHNTSALRVEYIHISATLSFIQDVLTEAILEHPRMSMARKVGLVKALSKVIWIQNDLFAKWYVRDGEEFEWEKEDDEVLVPEAREGGGCPFAGSPLRKDSGADDAGGCDERGHAPVDDGPALAA